MIFSDGFYIIWKAGRLDELVEFDGLRNFDEGHVVAHLILLVAAEKKQAWL